MARQRDATTAQRPSPRPNLSAIPADPREQHIIGFRHALPPSQFEPRESEAQIADGHPALGEAEIVIDDRIARLPLRDKRIADAIALLEACQIEPAITLVRELIAEAVVVSSARSSTDDKSKSAVTENVMRIIEPMLHSLRAPPTSTPDRVLSSMAATLNSRLAVGLGLSDVLPGTLAALLIARTERQGSQIAVLLELARRLSSL